MRAEDVPDLVAEQDVAPPALLQGRMLSSQARRRVRCQRGTHAGTPRATTYDDVADLLGHVGVDAAAQAAVEETAMTSCLSPLSTAARPCRAGSHGRPAAACPSAPLGARTWPCSPSHGLRDLLDVRHRRDALADQRGRRARAASRAYAAREGERQRRAPSGSEIGRVDHLPGIRTPPVCCPIIQRGQRDVPKATARRRAERAAAAWRRLRPCSLPYAAGHGTASTLLLLLLLVRKSKAGRPPSSPAPRPPLGAGFPSFSLGLGPP